MPTKFIPIRYNLITSFYTPFYILDATQAIITEAVETIRVKEDEVQALVAVTDVVQHVVVALVEVADRLAVVEVVGVAAVVAKGVVHHPRRKIWIKN